MGCARVTVHSISSILLFISLGFLLASCIVPQWLRYERTYKSRQYYLGLFEYCYYGQAEPAITSDSQYQNIFAYHKTPYRCVLNTEHRTSFPLHKETPIMHALQNVTVGLIVTSTLFCFLGAIFATFCCCDSSVGVGATLFWMMTNFLAWSCSVSAIAFFAAKKPKNMLDSFIPISGKPHYFSDETTLGMSFYFACVAMGLMLISMIMSFVGPCMAYNAKENALKKKQRRPPSIRQPVDDIIIEMKEPESVGDTEDSPVEELYTTPIHKSVMIVGNSDKSVSGSIVSIERAKSYRRAQQDYTAEPKLSSFQHQGTVV